MSLEKLIEKGKFDYVNINITEEKFPLVKIPKNRKYKVFHFDRYISSEDAIREIRSKGYELGTIYDLLSFDWDGKDWMIALGSVAEVDGGRGVACLGRGGSERSLGLGWFDGGWGADDRFLAFATSPSDTRSSVALSPSDSLILCPHCKKEIV